MICLICTLVLVPSDGSPVALGSTEPHEVLAKLVEPAPRADSSRGIKSIEN